jgi:hypothetical protein
VAACRATERADPLQPPLNFPSCHCGPHLLPQTLESPENSDTQSPPRKTVNDGSLVPFCMSNMGAHHPKKACGLD